MQDQGRKYAFNWSILGDIPLGRPNLGEETRIEMYRLMQYTFRDVIERKYGTEAADEVFYEAGKMAGASFFDQYLTGESNFDAFINHLQKTLIDLKIGVLRIEAVDLDRGEFTMTVAEDLDCSGMADSGIEVCVYDEGFLAAILERFTGKPFAVREVDCWSTGGRICRFVANEIK